MKKMIVLWLAVLLLAGCTGTEPEEAARGNTETLPPETEMAETELPAAEEQPDAGEEPVRHMLTAHTMQQGENAYYVTCGDTFVLLRWNPETMLFAPYNNRDFRITDREWAMVTPTSDGRILLWDAEEPTHYYIWFEEKLYLSGEYDQILWLDGDWILAAYDGMLGVYNADGDLIQTVCPWEGGMAFRQGLSGWYDADPTGGSDAAGMYIFLSGAEHEYYVIGDTGAAEQENAVPGMLVLQEETPIPPQQETTWYLYRYRSGYITADNALREEEALPTDGSIAYVGTYTSRTQEPWFDSVGGRLVIGELGQWTMYDPETETAMPVPVPEGTQTVHIRLHPETGDVLGSVVTADGMYYAWCSPEGVPLTDYRFHGIGQYDSGKYLTGMEYLPETEDEYDFRHWIIDAETGECREIEWAGVDVKTAGDTTYFLCNDWYDTSSNIVVLKEDLTPLADGRFWQVRLLADGRMIGIPVLTDGENKNTAPYFEVYGRDGILEYTSSTYDSIQFLCQDYLWVVKDGILCLIDKEENLLETFGPWTEGMFTHFMISGYKEETTTWVEMEEPWKHHFYVRNEIGEYVETETDTYPTGLYLVTEDNAVENGITGRVREYIWDPETGDTYMLAWGEMGGYAKPVLYLYPEAETDVTVTFARPEVLTTVYPAYGEGWQVTARPDGTLTDERGREYYALYWEESGSVPVDFSTGFCVAGEDAAVFLEEKLDHLGLTNREANEMILYWLPILERNPYSLVYFELTESREAYNRLQITPAPDSLLRIAIHIKAAAEPTVMDEQRLPVWKRDGFSAVEWGGVIHE